MNSKFYIVRGVFIATNALERNAKVTQLSYMWKQISSLNGYFELKLYALYDRYITINVG